MGHSKPSPLSDHAALDRYRHLSPRILHWGRFCCGFGAGRAEGAPGRWRHEIAGGLGGR